MSEWWTYTLADLLMFSARTYDRLFELYNRAVWPLHVLAAALAVAVFVVIVRPSARGRRTVYALLGIAWAWIAVSFHLQRYADINTAAPYFAAAYLAQACVLLFLAFRPADVRRERLRSGIGLVLVTLAVFGYPLLAALGKGNWMQAEVFGIAPDPTAIATLGFLLASRGRWMGWVVPVLWCVASGLTLLELGASAAWLAPAAAMLAVAAHRLGFSSTKDSPT